MKLSIGENPVLTACLDLLAMHRVFAWRNNNVAVYDRTKGCYRKHVGLDGVSDILGVLPSGRFLGVECKRPAVRGFDRGGVMSKDQRAFLAAVNEAGGVGVCVSDVGRLAAALAALEADPWARLTIEGEVV